MPQKGISPLISAVLLIAFTISIGGLFAEWSGSLIDDSTQDNSEAQQQLLDCSSMQIEIVDIEEDYSNSSLEVTLRADNGAAGNITVTSFPSLAVEYIELSSAGAVGVVTLDVSEQQNEIQATSQECNMETSQDIE